MIGDIAMYQAYFTSILMSVNQIINVFPQLAKGMNQSFLSPKFCSRMKMPNIKALSRSPRSWENSILKMCTSVIKELMSMF